VVAPITQAIVLAGGLGTRLRAVISEVPKVLAPVAGRPFVEYILERLEADGCGTVVLAVGYLRQQIIKRLGHRFGTMEIVYSVEETPLGTGGAIRQALLAVDAPNVLVVNGDTWLDVPYRELICAHDNAASRLTVTVARVGDVARYGAVELDDEDRIIRFTEKGEKYPGLINGGTYVLERTIIDDHKLPPVFSFESDFLVPKCAQLRPLAFLARGRFIDIGIPTDYALAQHLLCGRSTIHKC
jgi:D-glycero-alpha-D-manno-heptose 1-phosphate guanylyltransferase